MTLTFLQHQWKSFWRSKNTGKSIAVRIILGVFILYILLNFLFLSFFLDKIIIKTFPGNDVVAIFNNYLLYYFLADLLMRFHLQELSTLSVQPYLNLPIRRRQIVNFLSFTSLWSAFNVVPFILTLPFLFKNVLPKHGGAALTAILITIFGLTLFNHFFSTWIKRRMNLNSWFLLAFLGGLVLIALLEFYWKIFSLSSVSSVLFNGALDNPWLAGVPVLAALIILMINHRFLESNLYLDQIQSATSESKSSTEIPFLNRFGKVGDLAANEFKLILRNKRSKSTLMLSFILLFYGLLFYRNTTFIHSYWRPIFAGVFITGTFVINYGQFMFSWQSAHFDGLLSSRIDIKDFFRAKFLLFTVLSTLNLLLTIPYVYFGWTILLIHLAMYIWNLGVNTLIVLYFANRNYKRIDLSRGASFNWEGVGASQWILSIPLLITPFAIYAPAHFLGYPEVGIVMIAIIGLIFIVTREFWLNKLVDNFNLKRYLIAEGFRTKE